MSSKRTPLSVQPLHDIPEITTGMDIGAHLADAVTRAELTLERTDVLVVAQKIVSKAEGRTVDLRTITPSPHAEYLAAHAGRDPRLMEVILRETRRILKHRGPVLITETHHGFVCASGGVDESNVPGKHSALLLPQDPDASAESIRARLKRRAGAAPAVIISDTFGRPWRMGQTDVALGVAGMRALHDYRGARDATGKTLEVTYIAVADELAGAAELVMGKADNIPAALIRGFVFERDARRRGARELIRPEEEDLFR